MTEKLQELINAVNRVNQLVQELSIVGVISTDCTYYTGRLNAKSTIHLYMPLNDFVQVAGAFGKSVETEDVYIFFKVDNVTIFVMKDDDAK